MGEGFAGTIVKDTWTMMVGEVEMGGRWGGLGGCTRVEGKGRKLYLNNNKKKEKQKKRRTKMEA